MNKSALEDIQQALNAIRGEIERVDDETKWAALELMLSTSNKPRSRRRQKTQNERTNAHKEVKRLCKEFGFTVGMPKGSLAEGRKKT